MLSFVLGAFAIYFGACRIAGYKSPAFQAIAHLFVGLLIGMAYQGWLLYPFVLVVALSIVEIICFLTMRSKP